MLDLWLSQRWMTSTCRVMTETGIATHNFPFEGHPGDGMGVLRHCAETPPKPKQKTLAACSALFGVSIEWPSLLLRHVLLVDRWEDTYKYTVGEVAKAVWWDPACEPKSRPLRDGKLCDLTPFSDHWRGLTTECLAGETGATIRDVWYVLILLYDAHIS